MKTTVIELWMTHKKLAEQLYTVVFHILTDSQSGFEDRLQSHWEKYNSLWHSFSLNEEAIKAQPDRPDQTIIDDVVSKLNALQNIIRSLHEVEEGQLHSIKKEMVKLSKIDKYQTPKQHLGELLMKNY